MTHNDPHAFPPDDGPDQPPHDHDDGWGAVGDHHHPQDHAHDHSGWGHGDAHHDHVAWEQSDYTNADPLTADDVQVEEDGSLALHAVSDHGDVELGDFVDVRLPNGDHVAARVTDVDSSDRTYHAVVSSGDAHSLMEHLLGGAAEAGGRVAFEHLWHTAQEALCHGQVIGTDGLHLLLGGSGIGADSNGAPVFDLVGNLVGQVVGFDPAQGVAQMVSADDIMSGLADFAGWAAEAAGNVLTSLLD